VDARVKPAHDDGMSEPSGIADEKSGLRRDAIARRDALPSDARQAAAEAIAARPFPLRVAQGTIVSGFMAIKSEVSPLPLMRKLAGQGALFALPAIAGRGQPLVMRAWQFGAPLDRGQWGIREPGPGAAALEPDILLVPLLAFDRAGFRLGYGAGYYDMTINRLRGQKPVAAVGIAFAAQEVPRIPTTPRDARLDLVLTEREVIDFRAS
jgi:5-formyltetrahydrofolate cyclo-ligase